jgi:hypothetical protein
VARFTPVLASVIRAQEAAHAEDCAALKRELTFLADTFNNLTHTLFYEG